MEIINLSGKDLYDCAIIRIGPFDDAQDGELIGNLMMGDSYVVKGWNGGWRLLGYDKYGNPRVTKVIRGTRLTKFDFIED